MQALPLEVQLAKETLHELIEQCLVAGSSDETTRQVVPDMPVRILVVEDKQCTLLARD